MVPDHWSNDAMVSMDRCGLLEVPNSFRDSAMEEMQRFYRLLTHIMNVSWIETLAAFFS